MQKFGPASWSLKLKDDFFNNDPETNVIIVDYGDHHTIKWLQSVQDIRVVGAMIGKAIVNWDIANRSLLVGLSLGGQVIAEAGRYTQMYSKEKNGKLSKIKECHSLDPAGPNFNGCNISLNRDDCEVVQVIHTNAREYPDKFGDTSLGTFFKGGHCDYWFNCGFDQRCGTNMCSHIMSLHIYMNYVQRKCDYEAIPCPNCGNAVSPPKRKDCLSQEILRTHGNQTFLMLCSPDMNDNFFVASDAKTKPHC
jgi:hypothetical protein